MTAPTMAEAGSEGVTLPVDIAALVLRLGEVEWGQTEAFDADGHGAHVAESVRTTSANFAQEEPQHMHGLYLKGTETVVCHTGTSPNSPEIARALTGAWNWLVEQARMRERPDGSNASPLDGKTVTGFIDCGGPSICQVQHGLREANARLLEALEKLVLAGNTRALRGHAHVPSMRDEQDARQAARAAIAAAKGSAA